MFNKRSKSLIIKEILTCCVIPTRFTYIIYNTKINGFILNIYIKKLISKDLLEKKEWLYNTTTKGEQCLKLLNKWSDLTELEKKKQTSFLG